MRHWFLSYNSQDFGLIQSFEAALRRKDAEARIFFAPKSLRAGGLWLPELAREITEATAFVLLVGEKGISPWQAMEYYEALDRRVKQQDFPVVLLLLDGQPAPGLPFLRQLHWVITSDPASEKSLVLVMDAVSGDGVPPGELWRHTAPYRGLAAMTEADSDYFFGRARETAEVIGTLASTPDKLPILLGNSGVGKSSLAQAGAIAALMRQAWPEMAEASGWPPAFDASRRWCFLKLKPGTEPLRALVEPFLWTWQFDAVDPKRAEIQSNWVSKLLDGKVTLRDLLDATQERYRDELGQPEPPAFLIYIDQGEELYVRAEERERRRFSEILGQNLGDPRLRAMMSLRADFFGDLQKDEPLYGAHRLVNVPPLRETQLREVVSQPAVLLSARFEPEELAAEIAQRAAEESVKDAGALPLLSYLLDDMWTSMVKRGDGRLRLPKAAVEIGTVLINRADAFLRTHPNSEDKLRRIFTLRLATVREGEEPTRRRALRSEFSDDEWRLVTELADHPNRLLITATSEAGETYAEVAHEAVFKRWEKLRDWIAAEREFLAWRSGMEAARRAWQATPDGSKDDALLMGLGLAQARSWMIMRAPDLSSDDLNFIELGLRRETLERKQRERLRRRVLQVTMAALAIVAVLAGIIAYKWADAESSRADAENSRDIAKARQAELQKQRNGALLNDSRRLLGEALKRLIDGDAESAALLSLEGLPSSPEEADRPYLGSLEPVLYQSLLKSRDLIVVNKPIVSGDERLIAVLEGNSVSIYDSETGIKIVTLAGHHDKITEIAFGSDGRSLATGSADETVRIWDIVTGRQTKLLEGHKGPILQIGFYNDGRRLWTSSEDATVRLWTTADGTSAVVLGGHEGKISEVSTSPDGQRIATVTNHGVVRIWNTSDGEQVAVRELPRPDAREDDVSPHVDFSSDSRWLLGTARKEAVLWDTTNGHEATRFSNVSYGRFYGRLLYLSVFGKNRRVQLWDTMADKLLFDESDDNFRSIENDRFVVAWSKNDKTATAWNTQTGVRIAELGGHTEPLSWVSFSSKGNRVISQSQHSAQVWDPNTGQLLCKIETDNKRIDTFEVNEILPRAIVRLGRDAELWSLDTCTLVRKLDGIATDKDQRSSKYWVFSEDGRRVTRYDYGAPAQSLFIWDAETGERVQGPIFVGQVTRVTFSSNGQRFITSTKDGWHKIWNVASGTEVGSAKLDRGQDVAFSPSGNSIFIRGPSWMRLIRLSDSGGVLDFAGSQVRQATFTPQAQHGVAAISIAEQRAASALEIHDSRAGEIVAELRGHRRAVSNRHFVFSHDGHRAATIADDGTARIWDARNGATLVSTPAQYPSSVSANSLAVRVDDKDLEVWDIDTGILKHRIRDAFPNNFFTYWEYISANGESLFLRWGTISRLWDLKTGTEIAQFKSVRYQLFDETGQRLFIWFQDRSARLIDLPSAKVLVTWPTCDEATFLAHGRFIIVFDGKMAHVHDAITGEEQVKVPSHITQIQSVEISPDVKRIIAKDNDGTLFVWDGESGKTLVSRREDLALVHSYFDPAGVKFVTADGNDAVLWDSKGGTEIARLKGHRDRISAIEFSKDGELILTASDDGDTRLFDVTTGQSVLVLKGSGSKVVSAKFSPDGLRIITKTENQTVRLWDAQTGGLIKTIYSERHDDAQTIFSPDGEYFIVNRGERFTPGADTVQVWDSAGRVTTKLQHSEEVVYFAVASDGKRLLSGVTGDGSVQLWDVLTGGQLFTSKVGKNVKQVKTTISQDGSRFAAVFAEHVGFALRLWEAAGHREILAKQFNLPNLQRIHVITFTPDGRRLIVVAAQFGRPFHQYIFDAESGNLLQERDMVGTSNTDTSVTGRPGRRILVMPYVYADEGSRAPSLWNAEDGSRIALLGNSNERVQVAFSADERWAATGSADVVRIWDAETGALYKVLSGLDAVTSLAFSDNGRFLVAGSANGAARVFDVKAGSLMQNLIFNDTSKSGLEDDQEIKFVAVSNDGQRVATISKTTVRVWDRRPGNGATDNIDSTIVVAILPASEGVAPPSFSPDGRLLLIPGQSRVSIEPIDRTGERLVRIQSSTRELVELARSALPRCLTTIERKDLFLDLEPPAWCIETGKWPYQTSDWKNWLAYKRANVDAPLPDTPEWGVWLTRHNNGQASSQASQ